VLAKQKKKKFKTNTEKQTVQVKFETQLKIQRVRVKSVIPKNSKKWKPEVCQNLNRKQKR
jgi:hypothetical protein